MTALPQQFACFGLNILGMCSYNPAQPASIYFTLGDAIAALGFNLAIQQLFKLAAIVDKKAGFRSLGDTWGDTTTAHGRLMLTVLGGLAEFEHELIRARTGEGRARAKERGIKMGRKPKLTPHQQREAIKRRDKGEPMREIARTYNVSPSTISRLQPDA